MSRNPADLIKDLLTTDYKGAKAKGESLKGLLLLLETGQVTYDQVDHFIHEAWNPGNPKVCK